MKNKDIHKILTEIKKQSNIKDQWIVDIKGDRGSSFEISVVKKSDKASTISYGWDGKNKIILFSWNNGGKEQHPEMDIIIWNSYIKFANSIADYLNKRDFSSH